MMITADKVQNGDTLVGIDNGYVIEVIENNGYLTYPNPDGYTNAAMPDDTILISFHDAEGNENYLLAASTLTLEVTRNA